jgi:hypothetical protein
VSTDKFGDDLGKFQESLAGLLQSPDILKNLGIPDIVRVSPSAYAEMQAGGSRPEDLPWGLKIEPDPDLKGEMWELGPKPAASAASAQAEGPATGQMKDPI